MSNQNLTVAGLLNRTVSGNSVDLFNDAFERLALTIDITAFGGTAPTLTVTIEALDPTSGKYVTILASAALNTVATTVLKVGPGATAAANLTANDFLPTAWRVRWVIGGSAGPNFTFSLGASLGA